MAVRMDWSRFHTFDELTAALQELAAGFPQLARLRSVGRSYAGRDLWLMEVTNQATGPGEDKPGYYVDGNIHAGEVTGAACALYTIYHLLTRHGSDPEVTRLVDGQVFYILPRVSPDGAEQYLTTPYFLRSSVRWYPFPEEQDGFHHQDVDGDGRVLQMRVPDPDGEWQASARDPRLLVPRRPDEYGGVYYRLMPEGTVRNFDGAEVKPAPPRWGLDLNRNFPAQWEPEARQAGAGPYPLSEPETRAVAEFLLSHPNIHGAESFHTSAGIHLRPSALRSDDQMNPQDRAAYGALARIGRELTGYPTVSIFDGFARDKQKPVRGSFLDWAYDVLGLLCWGTELWDLRVRAGLERVAFLAPDRDLEEEGLRLLAWMDRENAGEGFIPWYPCQHPQFGPVELGGWDIKGFLQNCPPRFLPAECHRNLLFTLKRAAAGPRLAIARATAAHLGDGVHRVEVVVRNQGYLPTCGTEMARAVQAVRPDRVELALPPGAELVLGQVREEIGFLDGRVMASLPFYPACMSSPDRVKRLEWVVRAPAGGDLQVLADSQRGGKARATVTLVPAG